MIVSESSRRAYRDLVNTPDNGLYDRQQAVLDCIARYPMMSANDVARRLRMENERDGIKRIVTPKDVCSRVNELLNDGKIQICGTKVDSLTKRKVRQYVISEDVSA